jgi:hypothetical protein
MYRYTSIAVPLKVGLPKAHITLFVHQSVSSTRLSFESPLTQESLRYLCCVSSATRDPICDRHRHTVRSLSARPTYPEPDFKFSDLFIPWETQNRRTQEILQDKQAPARCVGATTKFSKSRDLIQPPQTTLKRYAVPFILSCPLLLSPGRFLP